VSKRDAVDVDAAKAWAFGLAEDFGPFVSPEHSHDKHQLLFCARGTMQVSAGSKVVILPPQRAAWIPAGTPHRVSSTTGIELRTVYLARDKVQRRERHGCTVFAVTPLAREMLLYAMRWGARTTGHEAAHQAFFEALVALLDEWLAAAQPYFLPEAKSPEVERALAWIRARLADATVQAAARVAGMSVRTLSRRLEHELELNFRGYLQSARMMRAMELLSDPGASVTRTAFDVGFRSLGAFTSAFAARCGETPSEYRARVTGANQLPHVSRIRRG
jgi:AraC-like DNA-binding protein